MSKEHGGAAFPQSGFEQWAPEGGMTLRDYFAAHFASAQATATSADRDFIRPDFIYPNPGEDGRQTVAERIARVAYELADAMLAERAK